MHGIRSMIVAVVCLMSFVTSGSMSAQQPPTTHALTHIVNKSNAKVTVYYKWGDRPWREFVIEKGKRGYLNYAYDGQSQTSPNLYIRIDTDTDGSKFVEYVLSRGASPDDNSSKFGHHFVLRQLEGTDTRYLEAVTQGATVRVIDKNSSRPK